MNSIKLRIRLTSDSFVKVAGIISNSVILAANVYLIGTGIQGGLRARKQERISQTLHTTAEIASAVAGLTKVIVDSLGKQYAET
ncbi:MAG: hypothetical protein WCY30_04870 [Candidatus Neomarinimicrobiota bacterium]|jgi:hypothetical protein